MTTFARDPRWRLVITSVLLICATGCPASAQQQSDRKADAPKKLAVPAEHKRAEAETSIRALFAEDYAKAESRVEKAALAGKLLKTGGETSDDNVAAYVLFTEARRVAIEGGKLSTALDAIDAIDSKFVCDAFAEKAEAITALSSVDYPILTAREVANHSVPFIESAIAAEEHDAAASVVSAALETANRLMDARLLAELEALKEQVDGLNDQHAAYLAALGVVKRDRRNKEAQLALSMYLGLRKNDWVAAEQHAALSGDNQIQKLMALEYSAPTSDEKQIALADGWWDFAESTQGIAKRQAQTRAAIWYEKALPTATGLTQHRIEQRLKSLPQSAAVRSSAGSTTPAKSTRPKRQVFLSDLQEKSVEYWEYAPRFGFNKNGTIYGGDRPRGSGVTAQITLAGKKSPHGIFAHPKPNGRSNVRYEIGGLGYETFEATVGVDENRRYGPHTPLTFEVLGDGKSLWRSKPVKRWGEPQHCKVDVGGVRSLELRVHCPGDASLAMAVWCEPRLTN